MTDYQQGSYDQINATLCQLGRLRRGEISLIQFEEWLRSVQRTNGPSETEKDITEVCDEIRDMLIKKNRSYGDSALKPVRIFSKADAEAGLMVRIDDKLSRIQSGNGDFGEDTLLDLLGYFILLRIARKRKALAFGSDHGLGAR